MVMIFLISPLHFLQGWEFLILTQPTTFDATQEYVANLLRNGDIQMSFRFNVNPSEKLEEGFIGARVKYIYQDERQSSITFLNT